MRGTRIAAALAASVVGALRLTGCADLTPADIPHAESCSPDLPDVTQLLQHLVDIAPTTDFTVELEPGCYRVEGTLVVRGKQRFTVEAEGVTFRAFDEVAPDRDYDALARSHVELVGNTDLVIRGLTIDGGVAEPRYSRDAREHQHAFRIDGDAGGNHGVTLDGVRANRVWGDYVYVYGSTDVEVTGAVFGLDDDPTTTDGNGRQGIAVVDGHGVAVHDSLLFNVARAVIDIEPNWSHDSVTDVSVTNNLVANTRELPEGQDELGLTFFANQGADGAITERIDVSHNRLVGRRLWIQVQQTDAQLAELSGPRTYTRRDYRFVGNSSDRIVNVGSNAYARAVRIDGVYGVEVSGNRAPVGHLDFPYLPAIFVEYRKAHTTRTVDNWVVSGTVTGVPGHEGGITGDGNGTNDRVADHHLEDVVRDPVTGAPVIDPVTGQPVPDTTYASRSVCEAGNLVGDPLTAAQSAGVGTC